MSRPKTFVAEHTTRSAKLRTSCAVRQMRRACSPRTVALEVGCVSPPRCRCPTSERLVALQGHPPVARPSLCPAPMPQCQPALTFVDNGGRHPRVPRSPPCSYHLPSRLISNHKTLYEDHLFVEYTLALLGTTISVSLSWVLFIPPLGGSAHRLFYSYRAGPMPLGVSYVRHGHEPANRYIRNIMPVGIRLSCWRPGPIGVGERLLLALRHTPNPNPRPHIARREMRMRFYGVPLTASLCTNVVE